MFIIQLDDPAFKLNEQVDFRLSPPTKDVDWTLFDKHGRSLFLDSNSEEEADLEQVRRQQERVIIRCDVDDEDVDVDTCL